MHTLEPCLSIAENSRTAERGNRVMVPIGNAESSQGTQKGIVAVLGGRGLAEGAVAGGGAVRWVRMETAFPKHRSNLLRHRLPEQKGRWGGNVGCLGIEFWHQRVPPAIEMAAMLPSEGVHSREGNWEVCGS